MKTAAFVVTLALAGIPPAAAQDGETLLAQAYSGLSMGLMSGAVMGARVGLPPGGVPRGAPPAERGLDLSAQFDGPSRAQGDIGSCHAFASVALLEAAYFRRYGERIQLSEADLFMRRNPLSRDAYDTFLRTGRGPLDEGNDVEGDIRFALANGVATGMEYAAFAQRYIRYRDAERRTIEDLERQHRDNPWYVRAVYDPREHWVRLQQEPLAQRILQNYLTGSDPTIAAQREATRRRLNGMRLTTTDFTASRDKTGAACVAEGAAAVTAIGAELRAGRPVAISYYTGASGAHALIVSGYTAAEGAAAVLKTRNSWGPGGNHDMPANQACRIYRMASVN